MEKIREELICAVCLDFLDEPKVLQCAHSFCLRCLREVVKEQKRSNRSSSARRSLNLECPSCRHVTILDHGRVDLDLRTNANLKRLVQIISEEEKRRTLNVRASYLELFRLNVVVVLYSVRCKKLCFFFLPSVANYNPLCSSD